MCESGRLISTLGECYDLYMRGRDCYELKLLGKRRLFCSCSRGKYEGLSLCWKHSVSKSVILMSEVKSKGMRIDSESYFPSKFHKEVKEEKLNKEEGLRLLISVGLQNRVLSLLETYSEISEEITKTSRTPQNAITSPKTSSPKTSSESDLPETIVESNLPEAIEESNLPETIVESNLPEAIEESDSGEAIEESDSGEAIEESDSGETIEESDSGETIEESDSPKAIEESEEEDELSFLNEKEEDSSDEDEEDCVVIQTKYGEELYLEVESNQVYRLDDDGEGELIGSLLEVFDESKGVCFYGGKSNVIAESFSYESREYMRCVISGGIFERKGSELHYYGSSKKDKDGTLTIKKRKD